MAQTDSSLEAKIAIELDSCLRHIAKGAELESDASNRLLYLLEYYIPVLLSERYPEWGYGSLDGFYLICARKTRPNAAELYGWAILLNDPGVTPFYIQLTVSPSGDSIFSYHLLVGEPGNGRLGVSSKLGAGHHIETRDVNLDAISWKYVITSEDI